MNNEIILLKIFIGESDKDKVQLLYKQIVLEACKIYLARVTVIKGILGFGINKMIRSSKKINVIKNFNLSRKGFFSKQSKLFNLK